MGPAYIDRARARAFKAGEDGNKWLVVSRHLRSMAQAARSQGRNIPVGQALHYVQQVRRYYDALLLASSSNDDRVAMNSADQLVR
jgi:membrane-bound lytic murein transglycosylase F